jgi:glycosyltransferase involved in cell wall biosynthesis
MNRPKNTLPTVSIGMPVYNGEKTLIVALDSILSQTFSDFELIISDNASTDTTEDICRRYAINDSRIRYVRQKENLGAARNFNYVLNEARAEYFMWAASDDVKSPDFLEHNYSFLENNPDYVASTSPTRFEGKDFNSVSMGDASLTGDLPERVLIFFTSWHANSRFCSLMKTDVLKMSYYLKKDFLGSDWAAMLDIISYGKTNRHNEGYVVLGKNGFSNSGTIFKHYRNRWFHWPLPFIELIKATLTMSKHFPFQYRIRIMGKLAKLNYQAVKNSTLIEIKKILNRR